MSVLTLRPCVSSVVLTVVADCQTKFLVFTLTKISVILGPNGQFELKVRVETVIFDTSELIKELKRHEVK